MRRTGNWGRRVAPMLMLVLAAGWAASAGAQDGGAKLGVINVGRLLEESSSGQKALEQLKNLQEQKQVEARNKEEEISGLRGRLTEGRLSLSEERLAEMQKELEDKVIAYRRFQDDTQRQFQKKQVEVFDQIQAEVMPIITAVGNEMGFTLIFNKFESGLVFAREEIDITDIILERFDARKAAESAGG